MNIQSTLKQAHQYLKNGEKWYRQSKYAESLEAYRLAQSIFKAHQDWENYLACNHFMGSSLVKCAMPRKAIEIQLTSLEFAQKNELENSEIVGDIHLQLSDAYMAIGVYEQVTPHQLAAEAIYKAIPDLKEHKFGMCYLYMGSFYVIQNDHDKAILYLQRAIKIFQKLTQNDTEKDEVTGHLVSCYLYLGDAYKELEHMEEGLGYYKKALNITLAIYGEESYSATSLYLRLGASYTQTKQFDKGLEYLNRTLTLTKKVFGVYHEKNSFIHRTIGVNYLQQGLTYFDKAHQHFEKSIQIGQKVWGNHHIQISVNYRYIAEIYQIEKKYELALSANTNALKTLDPKFDSTKGTLGEKILSFSTEKKNSNFLLWLLHQRAAIYHECYWQNESDIEMLQKSFEIYELTGEMTTIFYDSTKSENTKLRVRQQSKGIYEKTIAIGIKLQSLHTSDTYFLNKAFIAAEKSKANLLATEIQPTIARLKLQIPESLLQEEQSLHQKWKESEKKLKIFIADRNHNQTTQKHIDTLQNQHFDAQRKYEVFIKKMRQDFPQYYELKLRTPIVSVKEVQTILSNREDLALVSYFMAEQAVYIFVIGQQTFETATVKISNDLTAKVQAFVRAINFSFEEEYLQLGYELYKILIAPIAPILQENTFPRSSNNKNPIAHTVPSLLIIPDGILSQLPFEALLTQPISQKNPPKKLPYLLLDYNIQYHYSASLWKQGQIPNQKILPKQASFVGFAPVYADTLLKDLQKEDTQAAAYHERNTRAVNIRGEIFQELLYSEKEVLGIKRLFENHGIKSIAYIHEDASIEKFQTEAIQHKYIHISAHSFSHPTEVNLSGIVFAPSSSATISTSNDNEMEYIFYLQDAYLMQLRADLVVLSCCETGVGKLAKGEGVLAMNRGFWAAGAKNVIYTLFKVYDEVSSILTQKLFQYILEGKSYAVALRLAKLDVLNGETALPKFWAGYVMIGV